MRTPDNTHGDGSTSFHIACTKQNSNLDFLKSLLQDGADINAVDKWGNTPLHSVVKHYKHVVKFLLDSGASVNARNKDGQTPLLYYVSCHPKGIET
jgi:ankyrin repeat protein